jgi:phosphoribosyl 1,2-cyclic phosphodiesterase
MPALRVLASGSGGNCSVLTYEIDGWTRFVMIDAGLSPRRTMPLLRASGLSLGQLDAILLTHLDRDHWHDSWAKARPPQTRFIVHRRHARDLLRRDRMNIVEIHDGTRLAPDVHVSPITLSHDQDGVTAFRFDFTSANTPLARLGFATDLGHVTEEFITSFRGVDVLAIESNYCPKMQLASSRPAFLKRRIMGGAGHLSNQQAREAIESIAPRSHVVLLHLSRECNRPELVAEMHAGADYALTISAQSHATRWVPIVATDAPPLAPIIPRQPTLFAV